MNAGNINGHLVFGVTGHDVVTTVANGKVLMKDRQLTQIDERRSWQTAGRRRLSWQTGSTAGKAADRTGKIRSGKKQDKRLEEKGIRK